MARLIELDAEEAARLRARHDVPRRAKLLVVDEASAAQAVTALVALRTGTTGAVEALATLMEPDVSVEVEQVEAYVDARVRLLTEYKALTTAQVAERLGIAFDPSVRDTAEEVRKVTARGQLLAVTYRETTYFPAFQFGDDGHVRGAVTEILPILRARIDGEWDQALWFTSPNAWLDGKTPAERLGDAPAEVIEAAHAQFDEDVVF